MTPKKVNESNRRIVLMTSRTIITVLLVVGLYAFFNKEPVAAKLLAMGGSIGLTFLLIISFKSSLKPKS